MYEVVIFDCECTSGSLRHILEDYLKKLQETLPKSVRTLYPFVFVLFNVLIVVVSVCKFNKCPTNFTNYNFLIIIIIIDTVEDIKVIPKTYINIHYRYEKIQ